MASNIVITREEEIQAWLRSVEKYDLDLQSKMVYAKRQGRQEGKQEILDLLKSGKSLEDILRDYSNKQ